MAAVDSLTFEGTFNNSSTGLFKTNTTQAIGSDDQRALVTAIKESYLNRIDDVKDEDDMASNSAAAVPTQQSVKAYVDAQVALKQTLINSATALTDAASIDLTAIKHTLTTASGRTFTISYTGDDITVEVTLNAASATQTFPVGSLCVSEGVASGDNTCGLSGTSGDKYIISIKKIGSAYYVVAKNFGQ